MLGIWGISHWKNVHAYWLKRCHFLLYHLTTIFEVFSDSFDKSRLWNMEKINFGKVTHLISIMKCELSCSCLTLEPRLSAPWLYPMHIRMHLEFCTEAHTELKPFMMYPVSILTIIWKSNLNCVSVISGSESFPKKKKKKVEINII